MQNKEGLKPCPFCGSDEAKLYVCLNEVRTEYVVMCEACGASSSYTHSKKVAMARWNNRTRSN